jgi:hypothetical protein
MCEQPISMFRVNGAYICVCVDILCAMCYCVIVIPFVLTVVRVHVTMCSIHICGKYVYAFFLVPLCGPCPGVRLRI